MQLRTLAETRDSVTAKVRSTLLDTGSCPWKVNQAGPGPSWKDGGVHASGSIPVLSAMEVISGWSPDAALKASDVDAWGSIPLTSAESCQAGMGFDAPPHSCGSAVGARDPFKPVRDSIWKVNHDGFVTLPRKQVGRKAGLRLLRFPPIGEPCQDRKVAALSRFHAPLVSTVNIRDF